MTNTDFAVAAGATTISGVAANAIDEVFTVVARTQVLTRGTLTRTSHTGVNHVAFSGRIGSKALKPGGYRATLTATAASHSSKSQSLRSRSSRVRLNADERA